VALPDKRQKVAILIDAENIPACAVAQIIATAQDYGDIAERRVYGNFNGEALRPWVEMMPVHALSPQTTVSVVTGKNSADLLLAIDATELLCRQGIDIFCIASSDSDFTQLAMRIRMRGKYAIGFGGAKAAAGLRAAFDTFFELDLQAAAAVKPSVSAVIRPPAAVPAKPSAKVVALKATADIRPYIVRAFQFGKHPPDQWLEVGKLSSLIRQANPEFETKNFGAAKFSTLLKGCAFLETQMHGTNRMQIRMRQGG
jgi:uncharacterized protein (TIGR00288 family)